MFVAVQKCCPLGEGYVGTACQPLDLRPSPPLFRAPGLPARGVSAHLVPSAPPCGDLFPLDPLLPQDEHYILTDGSLAMGGEVIPRRQFCVELLADQLRTFVCTDPFITPGESLSEFTIYPFGLCLSLPFLLATFLAYIFLRELWSLHGYYLASHIFCLISSGVFLIIVQVFSGNFTDQACVTTGYAIQFFFMATFFWLNVMCFDIYWAFSGLRNLTGSVKERERKKLILYSIYAWCTPLLILIITVAVDLSPSVPANSIFKPQVGVDKCFFREKTATWIYFYLPMALIILSNIFLFTVTAYRIWSHRKEAAVLKRGDSRKHDSTNDKERFSLYLKLFIVMGINWVMELLSSIVGGPGYLWYIPDFTNTLQGVFIFIIFVWKKRVRRLVRAKIYACFGKKKITSDARNGSSTRNTNSTDSSRTNNSIKMTPTTQSFETTVP